MRRQEEVNPRRGLSTWRFTGQGVIAEVWIVAQCTTISSQLVVTDASTNLLLSGIRES